MRWPWEPKESHPAVPDLEELLDKATYIADRVDNLAAVVHRQLDAVEQQGKKPGRQAGDTPRRRATDV